MSIMLGTGDKSRVSRSTYWKMFGLNLVALVVLGFVCISAAVNGSYGIAILAFMLIGPIAIYFRVIQMRRCRDIGWPAALPWIMLGLTMIGSALTLGALASGGGLSGLGIAQLISFADFGLMIALGSIKGRSETDFAEVFGGGPPMRTAPANPSSRDRFARAAPDSVQTAGVAGGGTIDAMDDAIARAVENYKRTGSATTPSGGGRARRQRAAGETRPHPPGLAPAGPRHGGFGRKAV